MTCETSGRLNCIAGESPKNTPVMMASPTLKHRTGRLMRIAASWGKEDSGNMGTMIATNRYAMSTPSAAPLSESSQRLGQQLPQQARTTGADRRAHREFMLPRRAPRQKQDRNIAAADQQAAKQLTRAADRGLGPALS